MTLEVRAPRAARSSSGAALARIRQNDRVLIVVDSSAWGASSPVVHLETLERWVAACKRRGASLAVPEVVMWELYEHYLKNESEFAGALEKHSRMRERHGLRPMTPAQEMTMDEFRSKLEATGARILRLQGETAVLALKDQVLQRGAGSTKGGSKVGAADSAWLRTALAEAERTSEELVLVTGDSGAVEGVSTELGIASPKRVLNFPELGSALGFSPAKREEQDRVTALLEVRVSEQSEMISRVLLEHLLDLPMLPFESHVEVESIDIYGGLTVLDGDFVDGEAYITGQLILGFDGSHYSGVPWDQWTDSKEFELRAEFTLDLDGERLLDSLHVSSVEKLW